MRENDTLSNMFIMANNCYFNYIEFEIARICIENYNALKTLNIQEFSDHCYISKQSIRKMIKKLNYNNYTDFRNSLLMWEVARHEQIIERYKKVDINKMKKSLNSFSMTNNAINQQKIDSFINKIKKSKRVIIISRKELCGYFLDFQIDMLLMGIIVFVYPTEDNLIIDYKEDDMIILISMTGRIFTHINDMLSHIFESHTYKMIITMNHNLQTYFDDIILIDSSTDDFECNYIVKLYFDCIRYYYYQDWNKLC